jgi:hypothetical protein
MLKLLAIAVGLGALGYVLRDKIMEGLDAVLTKIDTILPDPTEDETPVPDDVEGYGIPGSRAYRKEEG